MRRIPFVHSVALQAIGTHKLSIPHILACFFFIIVILCLIHATIDQNNIAGPIPSEIGNLSVLRILHLDYNQLSGVIPSELDNLEKLQSVTLGECLRRHTNAPLFGVWPSIGSRFALTQFILTIL